MVLMMLFMAVSQLVYSQDYRQEADKCLVTGDYDCVKRNLRLYQEEDGTENVSQQFQDAETCMVARILADNYFEEKEYDKAMQQYEKILKLNPKDGYAKRQYDLCVEQSKPVESPPTPAPTLVAIRAGTDSVIEIVPDKETGGVSKKERPKILVEYVFAPTAPVGVSIGYYQKWGGYLHFQASTHTHLNYRQAFTGGVIARIFNNGYLYGGIGYGVCGIDYYAPFHKETGIEIEAGARYVVFKGISLSLGYNIMLIDYLDFGEISDINIGIGYSF
jgi:tetratricopeptide (TPR) repeat protein